MNDTNKFDSINLDLIGDILYNLEEPGQFRLTSSYIAMNYPNEDATAYTYAFLDRHRALFLEEDSNKEDLHPIKKALEDLPKKINASGGWNLCIERYGLDKIAVGIVTKEAIDNHAKYEAAILEFLQKVMEILQ